MGQRLKRLVAAYRDQGEAADHQGQDQRVPDAGDKAPTPPHRQQADGQEGGERWPRRPLP